MHRRAKHLNVSFGFQIDQKSALQEILQIFTSHLHTQCNSMTRVRTLIGSGNIMHALSHSRTIYKHANTVTD
jgi:chemotaxis protein CheY-P-specific phosphatase CheC